VACGSDPAAEPPPGGGGAGTGGSGGIATPSDEAILSSEWVELATAPKINGKQDDLYFVTVDLGYAVNGNGEIHKTEDGGDTWELVFEQPGTYFRAVMFLDADRGFAGNIGTDYYPGVSDETPLYRTTDGGRSWTPVAIDGPTVKGICNLTKTDDQHLVAVGRVGGPSFIALSSDGGESWTSRDLDSELGMLIDAYFPTPEEGFIVGASSLSSPRTIVLHTTDAGASWEPVFTSTDGPELAWKISFPTPDTGYVSVLAVQGTPSSFLKTTDGGATWAKLPLIDGPYEAKGIGFINERIGWVGGEAPGEPAYRTRDGGETWEPDTTLGAYVNRFRFVDPWTGYAIGAAVHKLEVTR
jgi:photosystem II stability/assembly factor-like uncharacterized protein